MNKTWLQNTIQINTKHKYNPLYSLIPGSGFPDYLRVNGRIPDNKIIFEHQEPIQPEVNFEGKIQILKKEHIEEIFNDAVTRHNAENTSATPTDDIDEEAIEFTNRLLHIPTSRIDDIEMLHACASYFLQAFAECENKHTLNRLIEELRNIEITEDVNEENGIPLIFQLIRDTKWLPSSGISDP